MNSFSEGVNELAKNIFKNNFRNIFVNKNKNIVVIKDEFKHIQKIICVNEDNFDINIGVALGICYNLFGSKNAFRKFVEENIKEVK